MKPTIQQLHVYLSTHSHYYMLNFTVQPSFVGLVSFTTGSKPAHTSIICMCSHARSRITEKLQILGRHPEPLTRTIHQFPYKKYDSAYLQTVSLPQMYCCRHQLKVFSCKELEPAAPYKRTPTTARRCIRDALKT